MSYYGLPSAGRNAFVTRFTYFTNANAMNELFYALCALYHDLSSLIEFGWLYSLASLVELTFISTLLMHTGLKISKMFLILRLDFGTIQNLSPSIMQGIGIVGIVKYLE